MTLRFASLAALALAAFVATAHAEAGGEADAAPVRAYLESLGQAAPQAVSEGRQAAPATSSATVTEAQRFVIDRSRGER